MTLVPSVDVAAEEKLGAVVSGGLTVLLTVELVREAASLPAVS